MKIKIVIFIIISNIFSLNQILSDASYAIAEDQNRREHMQDAHNVKITKDYAFFGVDDGHGEHGDVIAKFVAKHLLNNIIQDKSFNTNIIEAITNGFLKTNNELDKEKSFQSGTTATNALIKNGKIIIGNTGDSRTIIISKYKITSSLDHKPNRPDEEKRINDLRGKIINQDGWRIGLFVPQKDGSLKEQGFLAMSRSLGDKYLYPLVIPNPEIIEHTLDPDDKFIILASDGIWDDISNEEAAEIVRKSKNLQEAANELMKLAKARGSEDNITVIVVDIKKLVQEMQTLKNIDLLSKLRLAKIYDEFYT